MKSLKEYMGLPTIRVGGLDSMHPMKSLGSNDRPPKGKGSRDMRAVGLTAEKNPRIPRKPGQAAIAMSQRAKVASERAKDPEKKKDLAAAHRVYQTYINQNKKSKD